MWTTTPVFCSRSGFACFYLWLAAFCIVTPSFSRPTPLSDEGWAECKVRPPCSEKDYFQIHTACDSEGKVSGVHTFYISHTHTHTHKPHLFYCTRTDALTLNIWWFALGLIHVEHEDSCLSFVWPNVLHWIKEHMINSSVLFYCITFKLIFKGWGCLVSCLRSPCEKPEKLHNVMRKETTKGLVSALHDIWA